MYGTIHQAFLEVALDGRAMIAFPPFDLVFSRMYSNSPNNPEQMRGRLESEHTRFPEPIKPTALAAVFTLFSVVADRPAWWNRRIMPRQQVERKQNAWMNCPLSSADGVLWREDRRSSDRECVLRNQPQGCKDFSPSADPSRTRVFLFLRGNSVER